MKMPDVEEEIRRHNAHGEPVTGVRCHVRGDLRAPPSPEVTGANWTASRTASDNTAFAETPREPTTGISKLRESWYSLPPPFPRLLSTFEHPHALPGTTPPP